MIDPEQLSLLASIAIIMVVAGFVHSAIGFGFGIVALALVPLVMEIKEVHVVVSIASVPMLVVAAWAYRKGVDWSTLRTAMLGAAIALPLGVAAYAFASQDWLMRGTGIAILTIVVSGLRTANNADDSKSSWRDCFYAGAACGFMAGAVSIAGPPIAALALKQGWSQEKFKAFVTQSLLVVAVIKVALLFGGSLVTPGTLGYAAAGAPFAILGVQIGVYASRRIPVAKFRYLVAIALVAFSGWMVIAGASNSPPNKKETPAKSRES